MRNHIQASTCLVHIVLKRRSLSVLFGAYATPCPAAARRNQRQKIQFKYKLYGADGSCLLNSRISGACSALTEHVMIPGPDRGVLVPTKLSNVLEGATAHEVGLRYPPTRSLRRAWY
eukprot:826918-Rhodomonas_salina.1